MNSIPNNSMAPDALRGGAVANDDELVDMGPLAITDEANGSVRLTAVGRRAYQDACAALGISPASVCTEAQLQMVREMDASMLTQRLLDGEDVSDLFSRGK